MKAEAWSAEKTVYADTNGVTLPKYDSQFYKRKNGKNHWPVTGAVSELKFGVI